MTKKMENLVLVFSVGGVDGGCYGVVSGVVVGGSEGSAARTTCTKRHMASG